MRHTTALCALFLLLAALAAGAAVPRTMSYQGVLRRPNGNPVQDGNYDLTFCLCSAAAGGDTLWTESLSVPVVDGLFTVILGDSTPLDLPFDETYWLGVSVGTDDELIPRVRLAASPYALRAIEAEAASDDDWEISGSDIYRLTGNVGIGMIPSYRLDVNGDVRAGTYHGDGSQLTGIVSQPRSYIEDWFAVSTNTTYPIEHGLGSTSLVFSVLFNTVQNDANAQLVMPMEHRVNDGDGNRISMCGLRIDDANNVSLHTGNEQLAEIMDFSSGESHNYNSGFYKVVVVAVD